MASELDVFEKQGVGTATTLSAPGKATSATSITVGSTANFPTTTGITFAIRVVDGNGELVAGTYTEWVGTVTSGTTLAMNAVPVYGSDQVYAAGSTTQVYMPLSSYSYNKMIDGLLVSHDQDGTMIDSLPLTTPKITTSINDANGNEVIKTPATASAVNEITVTNAATAGTPVISATGGDSAVNLNLRGKGLAKTVTIGAGATTIFPYDYVVSGCQWTGDSYGVNRNASMTAGVACINGNPVTVAAVVARTFTASKDTYCDVLDNGDGTGLLVYTEVANNAASPALTANSIRLAIVVTGATFIPNVLGAVNWGQEYVTLPLISSVALSVTDSLGNLICPRDPHCKTLGYRQIVSNFTTTTTPTLVDVTGLSVPFIVPVGRKIKAIAFSPTNQVSSAAGTTVTFQITESSTQLAAAINTSAGVSYHNHQVTIVEPSVVSAGLHTYKVQASQSAAGTLTVNAAATNPSWIRIELV